MKSLDRDDGDVWMQLIKQCVNKTWDVGDEDVRG